MWQPIVSVFLSTFYLVLILNWIWFGTESVIRYQYLPPTFRDVALCSFLLFSSFLLLLSLLSVVSCHCCYQQFHFRRFCVLFSFEILFYCPSFVGLLVTRFFVQFSRGNLPSFPCSISSSFRSLPLLLSPCFLSFDVLLLIQACMLPSALFFSSLPFFLLLFLLSVVSCHCCFQQFHFSRSVFSFL